MEENRLKLALLNIHNKFDVKPKDVIDLFGKRSPRRLK